MADSAARYRVLVVEDEAKTASTIALYLRNEGLEPVIAARGDEGLELATQGAFDLVILDLMLPGMNGREICKQLRQLSAVPIIMVTARSTESERIEGLDLGADDYVSKPFSPRELMARVRARLRASETSAQPLRSDSLSIDPGKRLVHLDSAPIQLTAVEFDLLLLLARHPGRVWTRQQLLDRILPEALDSSERTIDAHVKNIRCKIEPNRRDPRFIQTVFGVGYRFGE